MKVEEGHNWVLEVTNVFGKEGQSELASVSTAVE